MNAERPGRLTSNERNDVIVWAHRLGVATTEEVVAELRRVAEDVDGAVEVLQAAYERLVGPSGLSGGEAALSQLLRGWDQTYRATNTIRDLAREIELR